jgi:hypothetical protein
MLKSPILEHDKYVLKIIKNTSLKIYYINHTNNMSSSKIKIKIRRQNKKLEKHKLG